MKGKRQKKILELIEKYDIETQEELTRRLAEEGFPSTQGTISRDIRELKLTKVAGEGGRTEVRADPHKGSARFQQVPPGALGSHLTYGRRRQSSGHQDGFRHGHGLRRGH